LEKLVSDPYLLYLANKNMFKLKHDSQNRLKSSMPLRREPVMKAPYNQCNKDRNVYYWFL
jgi:hypothetical protein